MENQTKQSQDEPNNYGGMTRSEWLAAMKQTKTGDEAMALMLLAPDVPGGKPARPDSWIDEANRS